jgi:hypothetical protein
VWKVVGEVGVVKTVEVLGVTGVLRVRAMGVPKVIGEAGVLVTFPFAAVLIGEVPNENGEEILFGLVAELKALVAVLALVGAEEIGEEKLLFGLEAVLAPNEFVPKVFMGDPNGRGLV